jgi:FKBP-type peptidyl-prolyl cis-trans isomerase
MTLHKTLIPWLSALSLLAIPAAWAEVTLDSDDAKFSYALGYRIGAQVKQQAERDSVAIEVDAMIEALRDILTGGDSKLTDAEMQTAFQSQSERVQAARMAVAGDNAKIGDAFRMDFEKQEGVTKTDSGILYKVTTEGEGDKPTLENTVVVHYEGTTTEGNVFDSSYARSQPATFKLTGIIKGWQEVLQLMTPGSTYEVVIPPALAYGEQGSPGGIAPNSTLKFKIELIEVK